MIMEKKVFQDKEKDLSIRLKNVDNEIQSINKQISDLENKLNDLHAGRFEILGALANTQEFIKMFGDGK